MKKIFLLFALCVCIINTSAQTASEIISELQNTIVTLKSATNSDAD